LFNPGLKRYRLIGAYAAHAEAGLGHGAVAEAQLSELYASIGYFAAAIWISEGEGYVTHLGDGRRVSAPPGSGSLASSGPDR
jgi:hypothetical protein